MMRNSEGILLCLAYDQEAIAGLIPCSFRNLLTVKESESELDPSVFISLLAELKLVVRKLVFKVSDQVRHKLGCGAFEDG